MLIEQDGTFHVLVAITSKHVQDQLDIRRAVFVDEQGVPLQNEFEPLDEEMLKQPTHPGAIVLVAYLGCVAAGCMRLLKKEFGYKLGRFAVRQEFRGKGCGRVLLEHAHQLMGTTLVLVHV